MTACAYRSLEPVLEQRIAELRERRANEAFAVSVVRRAAAARFSRAVGGAVALLFALAALLGSLGTLTGVAAQGDRAFTTELLLFAWPAGLAAAWATRALVRAFLAAGAEVPSRTTGNAANVLASLEANDPLARTTARAIRWERASAAFPLAAVALLAPLTIHWLVWAPITLLSGSTPTAGEFGEWISISAALVGHAHVAVLVGVVHWAYSLRAKPTDQLRVGLRRHWGITLLVAIGLACIPGIVAIAIPPVLVAVTGLAFLPASYAIMAYVVHQERIAIEAAQTAL